MKKIISILSALVLILCIFSGCSSKEINPTQEYSETTTGDFSVSYSQYDSDGTVDLHTSKQEAYINDDYANVLDYAKGQEAYDKTNVITISYAEDFTLKISENSDMSDSFSIKSTDCTVSIDNLKINTTYFLEAEFGDTTVALDSVTTANCAPRIINVDGVKNVRDCGGWATEDGGTVKQGLLYRCGRLNESSADEVNIEITKSGKKTMLDYLGIKTDIDLRVVDNNEVGSITESPLGKSVNYVSAPMPYDIDIYTENKDQIVKVFKVLADKNNYPIIFHCNIGTDRTGMIAFLVNGLLGVSEDDLFRDYLFSNFADIGGSRPLEKIKEKESYYKDVMSHDGETLSEKVENTLLEMGVTQAEIDSIRSILK